ncbi:MAG: division/cell wall cluster transcriptional repressor MraZ [Chloroflexi bacterium]|nr:division/cell wall cluster transcriptional repressor MraZ [Chloroflexota bacterium]
MFEFLGQYAHSLDDKGRATIPSAFREGLEEGLVITRGKQHYLNLFPLEKWDALTKGFEGLPVYTQERPANLRRLVLAHAAKTKPDSHGRIRIPDHLRTYARIEGQAVLAGVGDHIEIWAPDLWQQQLEVLETISIDDEQEDMLRI